MEVITLADLNTQIIDNATVLFPSAHDLRVITTQVPSGLVHTTAVVARAQSNAVIPRYITMIEGHGAPNRREAMMNVLSETEKRLSKGFLHKR